MKTRSFLLIILLTTMLVSNCDPVAINEMVPDGSSRLCINSFFTADSSVQVYVTRGKHILKNVSDREHEPVTDATIAISGEGQSPITLLPTPGPDDMAPEGWYKSPSGLPAGKTYEINVSAAGVDNVSATCHIPYPVPLLKAELVSLDVDDFYMTLIDVYFDDPPETKNYYRIVWRLIRTAPGQPSTTGYDDLMLTNDPLFYYNPESFSLEPNDNTPLPVLFTDDALNGKHIKIRCKTRYLGANLNSYKYTLQIELQTLSKEHYLYRTTQALQQATKSDPFAQPVQIYSNVKNGFGIFAGASCSHFNIDL